MRFEHAVAVYDVDKRRIIGLFAGATLCAKYIFKESGRKYTSKVTYALKSKKRLTKTRFEFPVAIRSASEQQKKALKNEPYVIFEGYPSPEPKRMNGFDTLAQAPTITD